MKNPILRKLCVVLALGAGLSACSAQQGSPKKDESNTQIEAFVGKRGRLMVKDSYSLGRLSDVGNIQIDALVAYDPGGSQKTKGLRIEVQEEGGLERSNTSFIDMDELQGLSQALGYMIDLSGKWNGQPHEPYTEVTYTSKGEFQVGFYQQGAKTSAYCRSGLIGTTTAFLKLADLPKMKAFIDQAITLLNSK